MKYWQDIVLPIPNWLNDWAKNNPRSIPDFHLRMATVIDLARINVQRGGGPFAAAVFDRQTGELIAPGVNWVVCGNSSLLHAEIMALALAEQMLGHYELASLGSYELVTSTEPCCQCLGVLLWTGISSLVCGARSDDARAIGFDEGPRPLDWVEQLQLRGIDVTRDVMRSQANDVLRSYTGEIYNSHFLKCHSNHDNQGNAD